jgi:hypothetical protein
MTGTIRTAIRCSPIARIALAGIIVASGMLMAAQSASAAGRSGPSWHAQSPPVPAGAIASNLSAVSCAAQHACAVVGDFEASGGAFGTFAETWNGVSWTIRAVPHPAVSDLSGVSCTGARACTAVGDIFSGRALVTLAERWNGTSWTVQHTPSPRAAAKSFLIKVSCTSATACTATGFWTGPGGVQRTLAEQWNGRSWRILRTPNPAGQTEVQFTGVSCTSATACSAVGTFTSGTFAESWNGRTWTIRQMPVPAGGREGSLGGVSCTSARNCVATGSYFNGSRRVPLAEHWNGSRWKPQHAAAPAGPASSGLTGVSCVRASACSAVGFAGTTMLAERWNGRNWAIQRTRQPAGAPSASLSTVSCTSPAACTAAGFFTSASEVQSILVERYS